MRHILKEIALGNGIQLTTLCGQVPSSAYDYAVTLIESEGSVCHMCKTHWFRAKLEEERVFAAMKEQELARAEEERRQRETYDAQQRLKGTHPDGENFRSGG